MTCLIIIIIIMKDFTLVSIIIRLHSLTKYHESTQMFSLCKDIDGNTTASYCLSANRNGKVWQLL